MFLGAVVLCSRVGNVSLSLGPMSSGVGVQDLRLALWYTAEWNCSLHRCRAQVLGTCPSALCCGVHGWGMCPSALCHGAWVGSLVPPPYAEVRKGGERVPPPCVDVIRRAEPSPSAPCRDV